MGWHGRLSFLPGHPSPPCHPRPPDSGSRPGVTLPKLQPRCFWEFCWDRQNLETRFDWWTRPEDKTAKTPPGTGGFVFGFCPQIASRTKLHFDLVLTQFWVLSHRVIIIFPLRY
jgi:hypothetical protein